MKPLTSRERYQRMYEHRDADRIPITDSPWGATIERWQREGMQGDFVTFFGLDRGAGIGVDNSPRFEAKTIEENAEFRIFTTHWGATLREFRHAAGVPEFLDFRVKDPDTWREAKKRMTVSRDRVNWDHLKSNYPRWREEGAWIEGGLWFGFDVTHSWFVGTERILMAFVENPEWLVEMWNHQLDVGLALFDMIWSEGYTFDCFSWPDDMGYKGNQFFSLSMYRDLLKPVHQRAIDWAHAKGAKVRLHSCGDIRPLIPELVSMGLDCLNPIEVKAGMDPLKIKREFGGKLVLHGGVNAVLWDKPDAIRAEMERVIPTLKQNGGYVFSSDHSVPSSVSLKDFRDIVELAKTLGAY